MIRFAGGIEIQNLALQVRTVKVSNVSLSATEQDMKEFFSFSGDIEHIEMQRSVAYPRSYFCASDIFPFFFYNSFDFELTLCVLQWG